METIEIGFSPCPNDTFIFDAMVHGLVDTRGLSFSAKLEDVETLNQWARVGKLAVTKLSFATFLGVENDYALLKSGSALGRGVGPLLVSAKPMEPSELSGKRIAIPGNHTTANLLLTMAHPEVVDKTEVLFSEIEAQVLSEAFDAGLVIHESRFTYAERGLSKVQDLGAWWEETTGAAIPLGGIVVRKDIDLSIRERIDAVLKDSIGYAWERWPRLSDYVISHAQEMSEEVMRKHIELYVNEYTSDLGVEGNKAIDELRKQAAAVGWS
jgi:1,4-dihydroxy-6-naphthoate synthase